VCQLPCRLISLVQASDDPALVKYVIQTVGQGVPAASPNWPLLRKIQQTAWTKYVQLYQRLRDPRERAKRMRSKIIQSAILLSSLRQKLSGPLADLERDLSKLARWEAMSEYDLFVRHLTLAGVRIATGKLKKMQDLAQESSESLKEKMNDKDAETRWMAVQIVALKRHPLEGELIDRLSDKDSSVRQAAHLALVRLSRGNDFGPTPRAGKAERDRAERRWRDWWALQDSNPDRKTSLARTKP
jgi:hypothetical protein